LGIRFQDPGQAEFAAASRHAAGVPQQAQEQFDRWLAQELVKEIGDGDGNPALPLPCPVVVEERLQARKVRGLVVAGRGQLFSPEEAELIRIFALQGEAALRNVLLFEEVKGLALRDGLTGLYNFRHFREMLAHQVEVSRRYGWPLSLLFLDIDNFKSINDTYGHPDGDLVLKALADFLQTHVRQADVLCRYGGEEFVALLPQTSASQALLLAERLRAGIAATPIALSRGEIFFTVSIGLSCLAPRQSGDDLVKTADAALYQAKQTGKNRVCGVETPSGAT
jgi:diguanylate cyclase (GGDEF)-like protein